jgi:hypothetical protein
MVGGGVITDLLGWRWIFLLKPVLPVQAVGVDRWMLEVQNRGRAVGVEPEDVVGIPAGEPAGRDHRKYRVAVDHALDGVLGQRIPVRAPPAGV